MKYKTKPIERANIRERVEKKLRARGAVIFHGLIFLLGTALFLSFLPTAWENRFVGYDRPFSDRLMLYSILTVSFALHFIRYHFKHGAGYERHEGETAARINRELRRSGLEDAEEREAIIEIEGDGKLKNRRLLWQHFSLFLGINATMILLRWSNMNRNDWLNYDFLIETFYFVGAWGIALAAHALRYFFAYGSTSEKRQAKIDAEVAREMAALGTRRSAAQRESVPAREKAESNLNDAFLTEEVESRHSRSRA